MIYILIRCCQIDTCKIKFVQSKTGWYSLISEYNVHLCDLEKIYKIFANFIFMHEDFILKYFFILLKNTFKLISEDSLYKIAP